MFRTKICGVTSAKDAEFARATGAEAIGLNFFPESARFLAADPPPPDSENWGHDILRVGVFVNAAEQAIRRAVDDWLLDAVQLHGDESPEQMAELSDLRCVRAFRVRTSNLAQIDQYLSHCDALGCLPVAVLVDAWHDEAYGGSGTRANWRLIAEHREIFGALPVILAGGLDAENVAEAIGVVRPDGVDVASGVESSPGVKDPAKVTAFVKAALDAFPPTSA